MGSGGSSRKLNLGCGIFKKADYVNIDMRADVGADFVHDLNHLPYMFPDNEFDLVEADHVLEHLNDPFAVMRELHRIARNNAVLIVRVPHFSRGFTHPDHRRGFDVTFPYYFKKAFSAGFQGAEFDVRGIRMTWFAQKYLKRKVLPLFLYYVACSLDGVFSLLANLSPFFCSRLWCFWVGGFEEIEFHFVVKK